eukprot:scaffold1359_cov23-Tisochrysis_lutea.AAC.1
MEKQFISRHGGKEKVNVRLHSNGACRDPTAADCGAAIPGTSRPHRICPQACHLSRGVPPFSDSNNTLALVGVQRPHMCCDVGMSKNIGGGSVDLKEGHRHHTISSKDVHQLKGYASAQRMHMFVLLRRQREAKKGR